MMQHTILIAEDDRDIVKLLKLYLDNEGFQVLVAENGIEAFLVIENTKIDLVLLDIMMPEMDGYELTKKIREKYNMPIIFLTAMNKDSDKILGLNMGADDYLTKPFNPLEIVARVNANLRRFHQLNQNNSLDLSDTIFKLGELYLDIEKMTLFKNGHEIFLTPSEYKIVSLLMRSPGRVFTKVQIYEYLKGNYFENDDNAMMVHISNIRDKIESDAKNPKYLKTVRGLGYKFEEQ